MGFGYIEKICQKYDSKILNLTQVWWAQITVDTYLSAEKWRQSQGFVCPTFQVESVVQKFYVSFGWGIFLKFFFLMKFSLQVLLWGHFSFGVYGHLDWLSICQKRTPQTTGPQRNFFGQISSNQKFWEIILISRYKV